MKRIILASLLAAAAGWAQEHPPDLGPQASLHGKRPFPADSAWNQPVDQAPVDPNSDRIIAGIGFNKSLHPDFAAEWGGRPSGIPYIVVGGDTPLVPIRFTATSEESDLVPFPIPADAPIEGGADAKPDSDRHVLVVDRDHWKLFELFNASPDGKGWKCLSAAVFDLNKKQEGQRPAGWTSGDAAGLPIFPGLVRFDEVVEQKAILHALRFTVTHSRHAYVSPARHFASRSQDPFLPPMGMRVRLKATVDLSGFPSCARVILQALKTYGMIVADNGGDWFVSGTPDARWNDEEIDTLKRVHGRDFEVVQMGNVVTR
jgi:hypothetical protein